MAGYTIGEFAALTHVTVRTLHHYDEIGLLSPCSRTAAGYRRYSERDLERLQRILLYRELGFSLGRIAAILASNEEPRLHLIEQKRLLRQQIERLQAMAAAVDQALEAYQMKMRLTPEERFQVFGTFNPEDHEAEARERWDKTPAFAESQRRVEAYSKEDWQRMASEAAEVTAGLAALMQAGTVPDSPPAMDLAERHRQHISRWFYECDVDRHRGLGEMYVADPRFAAHYDAIAPGLAAYLRDAIQANSQRGRDRR